MKLWSKSLVARMFTFLIVTLLVTLSLMGGLVYALAQRNLTQSTFERLSFTADYKKSELDRWVSERLRNVLLLARLVNLRGSLETLFGSDRLSAEFAEVYQDLFLDLIATVSSTTSYDEILIVADNGEIVISTEQYHEGDFFTSEPYYQEEVLETFISKVYRTAEGQSRLTISTPLFSSQGGRLGVLVVHLNLDVVNNLFSASAIAGVDDIAESYLVDRQGNFVTRVASGSGLSSESNSTTGIAAALAGKSGDGIYVNYLGQTVLGVYKWLPEYELALLAEVDRKLAVTTNAQSLLWYVFLAGIIISGVLASATFVFTRQSILPLREVNARVLQVAAGDFSQKVPVKTDDEIGVLARAFNQMTEQLLELYADLEEKVVERTQILEKRSAQFEAAAQVSRAASAIRDVDMLLSETVRLIPEYFGYYHAGIFLLDEVGAQAVLQAASSEGGLRMLERGHKLAVGQGIVGSVAESGQARIALDVGADSVFFDNVDLPLTRSEVGLPLKIQDRKIGVLDVQSVRANVFSNEDVAILQIMADQVALAIQNARLLQDSERVVRELESRYGEQLYATWQQRLQQDKYAYHYDLVRISDAHPELQAELASTLNPRAEIIEDSDGRQRLIAPIRLRNHVLGSVVFRQDEEERPWEASDLAVVESVCDQIGQALDNARLLDDAQIKADREQLTGEITASVRAAATDIDAVLQTTIRELGQVLKASGSIQLTGMQEFVSADLLQHEKVTDTAESDK